MIAAALISMVISTGRGSRAEAAAPCQVGNGIEHVVEIVFDNGELWRDRERAGERRSVALAGVETRCWGKPLIAKQSGTRPSVH